MPPLALVGAGLTAAGVLALLFAEHAERRAIAWLAKPAASTGFLVAALGVGAMGSRYGRLVVLALALCWLGDVLLIPAARAAFLAGLGSFLAGHVVLGWAFVERGVAWPLAALALAALSLPSLALWRWLSPHLDRGMRGPVVAYLVVIVAMVSAAAATRAPLVVFGAVAFLVSDLAVARDRFVAPGFVNRAWGLPLYYAAVLALAWSASTEGA
ncbi:MAG: lysoplasmalogenase [Sorangiineae bacterium]|nr:lysoplasmalogenase [Polyangiaceae bacterium]MEB2324618.1 lysoplasmalogenase [Sorangiineae bacterium]